MPRKRHAHPNRTKPQDHRSGTVSIVPRGARPDETPMAPGQEARLARFLNRGMYDRNGRLTVDNALFRGLGRISWVRPIPAKRITQMVPYCREPRFPGDTGFTVEQMSETPMGPAAEARRRVITNTLLHGGPEEYERPADKRPGYWAGDGHTAADPLPVSAAKLLEDSLLMDSAGVRIEPGRNAKQCPVAWWKAEDGARMRRVEPKHWSESYRPDLKYCEWVILDRDEQIKWELGWEEFAAFIRNPSTSEESYGLGNPELACCLEVITALVTAFKYNVGMFTEWKLPMGFLEIADCDPNVLEEFMTDIEMQVGGAAGHWAAVPYISKPAGFEGKEFIRWVELSQRPTDIQFRDMMMLAYNKLCAPFNISAEELGFPSFDSGKATMQEGSPVAQLEHSRDTGFVPLAEQLFGFLSKAIVERFDDGEWHIVVHGLGRTDEKDENARRQERLTSGLSSVEQEQTLADMQVRKKPLDGMLWAKTEGALLREDPKLLDDGDKLHKFTQRFYVAAGGLFSTATQFGGSVQTEQAYNQEVMRNLQAEQEKQQMDRVDPWGAMGVPHPDGLDGGAFDKQDEEQQAEGSGEEEDGQGQSPQFRKSLAPRIIEVRVMP